MPIFEVHYVAFFVCSRFLDTKMPVPRICQQIAARWVCAYLRSARHRCVGVIEALSEDAAEAAEQDPDAKARR